MSFAPISFSPVWFSTDRQQAALTQSWNDVSAIEPADFRSPVIRTFDLPFTRVRTSKPSPIDDFLLCVGGQISMPRIRDQSRDLRANLLLWHTVSQQGAMR